MRAALQHCAKGELVVCAITRGRAVGVDLEELRRAPPLAVAAAAFAPVELAALAALPAVAQAERFFTLWTLKEADVKARGLGLRLPLARIAFHLAPPAPPRLAVDRALDDDGGGWQLGHHRPAPDYLTALCVKGNGAPLRCVTRWERSAGDDGEAGIDYEKALANSVANCSNVRGRLPTTV